MLYPDWQFNYWLRSIFIPLSRDFVFRSSALRLPVQEKPSRKRTHRSALGAGLGVIGVAVAVGLMVHGSQIDMQKLGDEEIGRVLREGLERVHSGLAGMCGLRVQGLGVDIWKVT